MTEIEARTKWCPMARVRWAKLNDSGRYVTEGEGSFNCVRINFTTEEYRAGLCVASECMMWRTTKDGGYCGLAGVPTQQFDRELAQQVSGSAEHAEAPATSKDSGVAASKGGER